MPRVRVTLGDVLKVAPLAVSLFRFVTGRKRKEPVKITFPVSSKKLGLPKTEVSIVIPEKPRPAQVPVPEPAPLPVNTNQNTTMKFNKVGLMALAAGVVAAVAQPEVLAMLPGWASALIGVLATAVAALSGKAIEKK